MDTSRRMDRYLLRSSLRRHSAIPRVARCGRPTSSLVSVLGKLDGKGGVESNGFGGVETCSNVWGCPVCSARIRARRAEEISHGVGEWLRTPGRSGALVTLTLPHYAHDALGELVKVVSESFTRITNGVAYRGGARTVGAREEYAIAGYVKTLEVTYGANGWHPHLHVALLCDRELTPVELEHLYAWWVDRWSFQIRKRLGRDIGRVGVDVRPLTTGAAAAYVAKVQEDHTRTPMWGVGNELARFDLKVGSKGLLPFDLARLAVEGDERASVLWATFQLVMAGKHAIGFSNGLRALLGLTADAEEDHDTQPIFPAEVVTFGVLDARTYRAIDRAGLSGMLLDACRALGVVDQAGLDIVVAEITDGVRRRDAERSLLSRSRFEPGRPVPIPV